VKRAAALLLCLWFGAASAQFRPYYPGRTFAVSASAASSSAEVVVTTISGWGDSILAGSCNATSPLAVARNSLGAGWYAYNGAVSGENAAQILARYLAGNTTACLGEACAHVVAEGGVNSLNQLADGVTSSAAIQPIVNDMVALWDHALAAGKYVVATDVLPARGCTFCSQGIKDSFVARATTYNSLMALACSARASNPKLRCVYNYSAFEDPARAGQGYLVPAYDCDGIHMTQAGADALGLSIYLALKSLRGLP
jgi:hypothetical protein